MESDHSPSPLKLSSLRWKILRRALSGRRSSHSGAGSVSEESRLDKVSRKARNGFRLIPCELVSDEVGNSDDMVKEDLCFCYTLPLPNGPKIFLRQRLDTRAALSDFEVCNQNNVDSTGIVCLWPSEEVLAYYLLKHRENFRGKRVIELGSGYGLAGLVIAMVGEASEVVISDGNPLVVDYIQSCIETNSASFGSTKVNSMVLHWDKHDTFDAKEGFDIIIASDCTFFKEFHRALAQTIRFLLSESGRSEAILFCPRRGDSLDKFLVEAKDAGLQFTVTEVYDAEIWMQHKSFCDGDPSWPNYESGQLQLSGRFFSDVPPDESMLIVRTESTFKITSILASGWIYFILMEISHVYLFTVLSFISTSTIIYTVACVYAAIEISFDKIMITVLKMWKRLVVTFSWEFIILFSYSMVYLAVMVLFEYIPVVGAVSLVGFTVLYLCGFLYMTTIWHIAGVVSVLEESYGLSALRKSRNLSKGKIGIISALLLVSGPGFLRNKLIFDLLVALKDDQGLGIKIVIGILSVIFMLISLFFSSISQTIVYFVCKSYHHETINKSSLADHLVSYLGIYGPLISEDVQLEHQSSLKST